MSCSFPQVRAWYGFYKRKAESIFEMEVEGVSRNSVEMLALVLRIGAGRIETSPRVKPARPVLSLSSGHPPACLISWPSAVVGTLAKYCPHPEYLPKHVSRLHCRLVANHIPRNLADLLTTQVGGRTAKLASARAVLWCPLSFHLAFEACGAGRAIRRLNRDPMCKRLWAQCFGIPVAEVPDVRVSLRIQHRR